MAGTKGSDLRTLQAETGTGSGHNLEGRAWAYEVSPFCAVVLAIDPYLEYALKVSVGKNAKPGSGKVSVDGCVGIIPAIAALRGVGRGVVVGAGCAGKARYDFA